MYNLNINVVVACLYEILNSLCALLFFSFLIITLLTLRKIENKYRIRVLIGSYLLINRVDSDLLQRSQWEGLLLLCLYSFFILFFKHANYVCYDIKCGHFRNSGNEVPTTDDFIKVCKFFIHVPKVISLIMIFWFFFSYVCGRIDDYNVIC